MKNIIIFLSFCFFLSSCSKILSNLYGVEDLKQFDKAKCEAFITSLDFQNVAYYSLYQDSTAYKCTSSIANNDTTKKDMSQPIQIYYFREDSLISFHANCYAKGGLSNLNWNTMERFNSFPPKSAVDVTKMPVLLSQIDTCLEYQKSDTSSYTVFIYWTSMLSKISKDAINTVVNNAVENNQRNNVTIYLVNNDQYFVTLK